VIDASRFIVAPAPFKIVCPVFRLEPLYENTYRATIGVNQLEALGLDIPQNGVTVAVIDSGVNSHVDLDGPEGSRLVASVVRGRSLTTADDLYGHGTHVAGIIAGNGTAAGGQYVGVAPDTNLVNVRISNELGQSYLSDLIEGIQWISEHSTEYDIRVVNISLNSTVLESYKTSPISAAVEILWLKGMVVVVAAGNNGTAGAPSQLYPPANDPFVVTVGAVDESGTADPDDDLVDSFSAFGTTLEGFYKPDLVAPGRDIVSLLASTTCTAYVEHWAHRIKAPVGDDSNYFCMSGSSMSAPMVSGAAALLLQNEPDLTPNQVKYRLMASTRYMADAGAGSGSLQVSAALLLDTFESANVGLVPNRALCQLVAMAAYAMSELGDGTWDSVNWDSVNWDSVNWDSVNWDSVNWDSVNWDSVNWDSVNWDSAVWDD